MIENINTGDAIQEVYKKYLKVCSDAVKSEKVFKLFKSLPEYRSVLEHCSRELGYQHLMEIEGGFLDITKMVLNDELGSPVKERYKNIEISPTTLQYINVASNLKRLFGSLNDYSIIEIGGGYGGQCKVIQDYFNIERYDIIDLGPVADLQFKYLTRLKQIDKVNIFKAESSYRPLLRPSYDLVISNYALSEMPRDIQLQYVKNVCLRSKHGYLTCNDIIEGVEFIKKKFNVTRSKDIKGERETNYILTW